MSGILFKLMLFSVGIYFFIMVYNFCRNPSNKSQAKACHARAKKMLFLYPIIFSLIFIVSPILFMCGNNATTVAKVISIQPTPIQQDEGVTPGFSVYATLADDETTPVCLMTKTEYPTDIHIGQEFKILYTKDVPDIFESFRDKSLERIWIRGDNSDVIACFAGFFLLIIALSIIIFARACSYRDEERNHHIIRVLSLLFYTIVMIASFVMFIISAFNENLFIYKFTQQISINIFDYFYNIWTT